MKQATMNGMRVRGAVFPGLVPRWWNRPVSRALGWGSLSVLVYYLLFAHQSDLTEYFTRGGVYAGAVIGVAFAVTFVHSVFANYVLEAFGLRPSGKGGH